MRTIRKGTPGDLPGVAAICDRILTEEAGIVPCAFNGIPGVNLMCLEKKLEG